MIKNNFENLHNRARESAIQKIKKELEKQKDFYKLKKLNDLIKNEKI